MTSGSHVASFAAASLFLAACTRTVQLPPPAPPPRAVPDVAVPDVAADAGLAVVLISTDVPARVVRSGVLSGGRRGYGPTVLNELLCETTPCSATLPYGDYDLAFSATGDAERASTATVHVHAPTVVVNHTLGRRHSPEGQGAGAALGFVGGLTLVVALAALVVSQKQGQQQGDGDAGTIAAVTGTIGFGALLGGAIVAGVLPTTMQPGATTEWTPPAGIRAGAGLGVRF